MTRVYRGHLQVLLKSRWHNVQEPSKDPEEWREGFLRTGHADPLSDHPFRDQLRQLWEKVSEALGFGQKRREREQRRQTSRQWAEKALRELWPRLGETAKRRLAQHHATMIVCGDLEELRIWSDHLARHFGGHPTGKEVAFVQWAKTESNSTIGILVWYPGGSADLKYNLAHEIGHLIDRDAAQQRLSRTREFATALARDLNSLLHILPKDPSIHALVQSKPSEAFSWSCALAWLMSKQFPRSCPHLAGYLRRHGLD